MTNEAASRLANIATEFGGLSYSRDGQSLLFDQLLPALGGRSVPGAISATDGSVLARHPQLNGWLIWPAKEN